MMESRELLTSSGWFPGRAVDVSADVTALTDAGYEISEAAQSFLREYSHLSIVEPANPNPLIVDGVIAARDADPSWAAAYSEEVGQQLVPVAEYLYVTFWIDPRGELWGSMENDFGHVGSVMSAITGLFIDVSAWTLDRHVE